ncbi:MAG: AAA family ATPase [Mycobacteriales bacterium]
MLSPMRVGIAGKGGVGKSTIAAVLSRTLSREGQQVIAIDADSDPNLGVSIGLGEADSDRMRSLLDQSGPRRHVPSGLTPPELLASYGQAGPDDVTILLGARSEKAGSG